MILSGSVRSISNVPNREITNLPPPPYMPENMVPFPGQRREDRNYRASTFHSPPRDLPPVTQDRMIEQSFLAYRTNPMAHRLIEMQVNFVIGNGIFVSSPDEVVLALIRKWWSDPYNKWPSLIQHRLRDLYTYGEWVHRPTVNTQSGFVFISDVRPDRISAVYPDGLSHAFVDQIVLKEVQYPDGTIKQEVPVPAVRRRLDPFRGELLGYSGELIHHGINRTTDALRGVGELFPVLDFIDLYDDILFSRAEKIRNLSHLYYDVKIDGMSEPEMRRWLQSETNLPPRPGTVWAHNSNVELNIKTADLRADDHVEDTRVIKSHIVASSGWPGTWFDDPGTAGRAVGAEMAEPAYKNIVALQQQVEQLLRADIDYMLWEYSVHNSDAPDFNSDPEHYTYDISFSRPSSRDLQRIGPAFARLGQFIEFAGLKVPILSHEELRNLVVAQINQLGLTDAPMSLELPAQLRPAAQRQGDLPAAPPKDVAVRQQSADKDRAKTAQQVAASEDPEPRNRAAVFSTQLLRGE